MPRRPFVPVVAIVALSLGSGHVAWAAKKPSTTTTTLSPREIRIKELRALMGEASEQEAGLLREIAEIAYGEPGRLPEGMEPGLED